MNQVHMSNPLQAILVIEDRVGLIKIDRNYLRISDDFEITFHPESNRVKLIFNTHKDLYQLFSFVSGFLIYNPSKIIDHLDIFTSLKLISMSCEYQPIFDGYRTMVWCTFSSHDYSTGYIESLHNLVDNSMPSIENVIYEPPATIVFWDDGTKTIVKATKDTEFNQEIGLAMAISKRYFNNTRTKFIEEAYKYPIRDSKETRRKAKDVRKKKWFDKMFGKHIHVAEINMSNIFDTTIKED